MTRLEWLSAKKKTDRKFKGSIWEKLEYSNKLCPTCEAHIKNGICLNACHLGDDGKHRFSQAMASFKLDV